MLRAAFIFIKEQEPLDPTQQKLIWRVVRDKSNPLELSDTLFHQYYRINKSMFRYLLEVLGGKALANRKRPISVTPLVKLSACLRFFAVGHQQRRAGKDYNAVMCQSQFSDVLSEVLNEFESKLCPKWINFEMSPEEKRTVSSNFYNQYKIPGVVGCVDGIHIRIIAPNNNKHLYYNRRGCYSLNVLLVCDDQMRIRFIDATHPGAAHDSVIWKMSDLRSSMEQKYLNGEQNYWLLGDAAFPIEPWLLTPHSIFQNNSPESKFNEAHKRCRNKIEKVNCMLRNRWRCLLGSEKLYYTPEKAKQIVNVCSALHNICVFYNVECDISADMFFKDDDESNEVINEVISRSDLAYKVEAQRIRRDIGNCLIHLA